VKRTMTRNEWSGLRVEGLKGEENRNRYAGIKASKKAASRGDSLQ